VSADKHSSPRPLSRKSSQLAMACFLLVFTFGGAASTPAQNAGAKPEAAQPPEKASGERILTITVPVRPGDRCVVCGTLLQSGDKVYLVEGQRVGIMPSMEPQLRSDPWAYLARLKPRGGLFGGEVAPGSRVSDAWLLLGMYVVLGLVFSAVCAHRALNTGQAPIPWFFAGLLFNAFGYLALLLRPAGPQAPVARHAGVVKIPATRDPQACPRCGAENHPAAMNCLHCGARLTPLTDSEVTKLRASSN